MIDIKTNNNSNIKAIKLFNIYDYLNEEKIIIDSVIEYNNLLIKKQTEIINKETYISECLKLVMKNSKGSMNPYRISKKINEILENA